MLNLDLIEQELLDGAVKARKIAASVLSRVRKKYRLQVKKVYFFIFSV